MAEKKLIITQLLKIMDEIGVIEKSHRNDRQGYGFRAIDDIMAALQPLLIKHKVVCFPSSVHDRSVVLVPRGQGKGDALYESFTVDYVFMAEDGSSITAPSAASGIDVGDKGAYKAMAGALKYAVTQALMIPTAEKKDAEFDQSSEDTMPPLKNSGNKEKLLQKLTGYEEAANKVLRGKEWINDMQTFEDLAPKQVSKLLNEQWDRFFDQVQQVDADSEQIPF